jgi:RHS repeat-associated protein
MESATSFVLEIQNADHDAGTSGSNIQISVTLTAPDGSVCAGTNACFGSYACQNGTCTGSSPVTCTAQDQCHVAGVCDPSTGKCSNPAAPDGTGCNDGNACTQTDACKGGVCTGSNPVTCTASDHCHTAGTCDPSTGACSNPAAANGTACNDGNACTQTDSCQNGTCTGSNPVTCMASDQCHVAGTCDPSSGVCSNPAAANGTGCNDGNACTLTDACQSGACVGANPVVCTASDACHVAGTCDPSSGACSNPSAPDGTACTGSNKCLQAYACAGGTCTGSNPVTCTASDQCHVQGTCDPSSGACSNPAASDGTSCNDGNACTQGDSCKAGTCTSGTPVTCTASDSCHGVGTCNPSSGVCSNPTLADGTACTGSDKCNQAYACKSGACTGSNPVVCKPSDACHVAGVCSPSTGVCSNPPAPGVTSCFVPPDPATIAPPLTQTALTSFADATSFLYTSSNPVQIGMAAGTIDPMRAAVLRGKVADRTGAPLPGVLIGILNHPEFGSTATRADGMFDMAVNGGGLLTVEYSLADYLPVHRQVNVPWRDYAWLDDVALTPVDSNVTVVPLAGSTMQVARGSVTTDDRGTRQATVLFPAGTQAMLQMPDGSTQPLTSMSVRATEYTRGSDGQQAMPAPLPPASAYTYCVDFNADEAVSAGATTTLFNQPVISYMENFIGFPVATVVPVGHYNREQAAWIADPNGVVIQILAVAGGSASIDSNGDGQPDDATTLAQLGVSNDELTNLAALYQPGQTLWRVPLQHFTDYDYNWPPANATAPNQPLATPLSQENNSDCTGGSLIDCNNQVLRESVAVAGTPFTLNYASDRAPGHVSNHSLSIPLTGSSLPSSVEFVFADVSVAGRRYAYAFGAQPNQTYDFTWDGKDAYGREVVGAQNVLIRIGYEYQAQYAGIGPDGAFGGLGDVTPTGPTWGVVLPPRLIVWQSYQVTLRGNDFITNDVGAWSLNVHHTYDPSWKALALGTGEMQTANASGVLPTLVPVTGPPVDQNQAIGVDSFFIAPDGTINYFTLSPSYASCSAGSSAAILRQQPGPTSPATVIGGGACSTVPFAEGAPATSVNLMYEQTAFFTSFNVMDIPPQIAPAPDGSVLVNARVFALSGNPKPYTIYRIDTKGLMTTVVGCAAGNTACIQCNGVAPWTCLSKLEGAPANAQSALTPESFAVASDGTIYFTAFTSATGDNSGGVFQVAPDGKLHIVANNCTAGATTGTCQAPVYGGAGDGGFVSQATLGSSLALAEQGGFGANPIAVGDDGSIYFADDVNIRRIGLDGRVTRVAGNGTSGGSGDGGQATQAELYSPGKIVPDHLGGFYYADYGLHTVRHVSANGIITRVAGNGGPFNNGGTFNFAMFAQKPPLQAPLFPPVIALSPDGNLYVANGLYWNDTAIYRVQAGYPDFSLNNLFLASQDGSEVYQFTNTGQHVSTLDALTGAVKWSFGYDPTSGLLSAVTDASGNTTSIQRDGTGAPTAIVAPFGQTTLLTSSGGYLSSITDPSGAVVSAAYDGGGLMSSLTDARGGLHTFLYDSSGKLTQDTNPAGGSKSLTRTGDDTSYSVAVTTAGGLTTTHAATYLPTGDEQRVTTEADGTQTSSLIGQNGTTTVTLPDGTVQSVTMGPDPRFGMQEPIPNSSTVTTPSGLQDQVSVTRAVTLADPNYPLSLQTQTDTIVVNGRTYTRAYASSSQTVTTTTPAGRQTVATLDSLGRVVQVAPPGLSPVQFAYDTQGHITGIAQGARTSIFSYGPQGFLATATDPLSNVTGFTRDADGRLTTQLLPDAQSVDFSYDPGDNLTSLTPPGRPVHDFAYTPIDLLASYQPPALTGVASVNTSYAYNIDGQLTQWSRPDSITPVLTYDAAGRLTALTIPQGTLQRTYDSAGRVATMTDVSGGNITYGYDGPLVTSETFAGTVQGSLARTYDTDFRVTSTTVDGANAASFSYDPDSLLVQAGPLGITRDPQTGFVSATSAGVVTTSESRSSFGEVSGWSTAANGNALYSATLTRDLDGRITGKTETIGGVTTALTYAYDARGRLTDITSNGAAVAHYVYDANGNRTSFTGPSGTLSGSYDDQDRLLTYGAATYSYGANGELQSKTDARGTTNYVYDALGNLRSATLPDGTAIAYVIDARNRRVGKVVNGALVQSLLYESQLRPVAELDPSGNVVSRFVYATRANVPDVIINSGTVYRVITDQVGTVRLVVSTVDGSIAERIDYDEFGNVTADTAPGFQPFGFAGGLYDQHTKLVRFGVRDYDSNNGRWTAKDPSEFSADATNLYEYSLSDPLTYFDSDGLKIFAFTNAAKLAIEELKNNPFIGDDIKALEDARDFDIFIREKPGAIDSGAISSYRPGAPGGGCAAGRPGIYDINYDLAKSATLLKQAFGLPTTSLTNVLAHELGHASAFYQELSEPDLPDWMNDERAVNWENATRYPGPQRPGHEP